MLKPLSASGRHLSVSCLGCHFWCSTDGSLPVSAARQRAVRLTSLLLTLHQLDSFCCVNETLHKEKFPKSFSAFHQHLTPGEQDPLRQALLFIGVHTVQTGVNSQTPEGSSLSLPFLCCLSKAGEGICCCAGIMSCLSQSCCDFPDADLATAAA